MSRTSLTSLMTLCATLAACSSSDNNGNVTGPAAPTFNEASAEIGFGVTADGPFDVFFTSGDGVSLQSTAQVAAAQQPSAGKSSSGHVGFNFATPTLGLSNEQYSFTAMSTGTAPNYPARGEFEMNLTAANGVLQRFHGDVLCMATVGNVSRLAGTLTKVWINNVQRPITGATHVIWTVTDNGEGQATTDTASPMFFNNATNAQTHCSVGFLPPQFPNQEGNIQVR